MGAGLGLLGADMVTKTSVSITISVSMVPRMARAARGAMAVAVGVVSVRGLR